MPIIERIRNWVTRVLQFFHDLCSVFVDMWHHNFQYNYGYHPEVIRLGDLRSEPDEDMLFEIVHENFPMVHHSVPQKVKKQRRAHGYNSFSSSSSDEEDDDERSNIFQLPVMNRIDFVRAKDPQTVAVVLEPKPIINVPDDEVAM